MKGRGLQIRYSRLFFISIKKKKEFKGDCAVFGKQNENKAI